MLLRACVVQMGLQAVGPVATAAEALLLCTDELPALAILDVQLLGPVDGIELAQQLLQLGPLPIVFTSATDSLATLARMREVQHLAFLPKPYNLTSLRRVMELGIYGHISTPIEEEAGPPVLLPAVPGLFVRERNWLVRVALNDMVCVQMENKHCTITLVSGRRHVVRASLGSMLHFLGRAGFERVHRSWLVQLQYIESLDPTAGIIRLPNETEVPLGREYRQGLLERVQLLD